MMDDKWDEKRALLEFSGAHTQEDAKAKAEEIFTGLDNVVLNIAVTGETGAGKSSFVNAIRGVTRDDEGWAPTGVTETTRKPKMYSHPHMPNVKIWDLPGIGSTHFKAKTYMKDVQYENYDLFIIVSAARFKENDITLAKKIRKKKKNYYFVRSKIDVDVMSENKNNGKPEEDTLQEIRRECKANLEELGHSSPVFLITTDDLQRFDFDDLVNTLEMSLGGHKRDALVLSLPVYSMKSLQKKYDTFKKAIWAVAVVSGGIGAVPVPGLSFVCNSTMVLSFLTKCYYSFGLNEKAMKKLSQRVNKPKLLEEGRSKLVLEIGKASMLTTKMAAGIGAMGVFDVLSSFVPLAGNLAAAGVSFVVIRAVLNASLDELYSEAKKVMQIAELE